MPKLSTSSILLIVTGVSILVLVIGLYFANLTLATIGGGIALIMAALKIYSSIQKRQHNFLLTGKGTLGILAK